MKNNKENEDDYLDTFKKMLLELSQSYKEFPLSIIELIAENYNIPDKELKILIRNLHKNKMLILKNNLFLFNF
ncbi:MAG: hypothetical protein CEE43_08005 [Promethearchaeota archaeon Loki_b32]|nr:MAG: hypothetical protein CEE43_08005 [Candidatus Lokiarchaeota archaeon Loki_b32]